MYLNQPTPEECHHESVNTGSAHNAAKNFCLKHKTNPDAQEQPALVSAKASSAELVTDTGLKKRLKF